MAGGLKMWIMGVAHWATRKTKQKSDLALSYVKYTYMHTKTHTGEISRNQWCVPSCLLHSQTSQLRRHRRKATIFSGPRNSSSLNVTIIEWGPDPEAVSGQLLLRSLVWKRWLVQPQSDCLWMQKTSISRVHGSSGGIAHPPHPPPPALIVLPPPRPQEREIIYLSCWHNSTSSGLKSGRWLQVPFFQLIALLCREETPGCSLLPLPGDLGRIGENPWWVQIWSPPPLLSGSVWNRKAKIKETFPYFRSEFLVSACPSPRIDFFPGYSLRPQSLGGHTLSRA